jgi:hypothetical protein
LQGRKKKRVGDRRTTRECENIVWYLNSKLGLIALLKPSSSTSRTLRIENATLTVLIYKNSVQVGTLDGDVP